MFSFIKLNVLFLGISSKISLFQVIEVVRHPRDKAESKYNPDAGVSKEEEEKYQKLVTENEELQRLIAQVKFIPHQKSLQSKSITELFNFTERRKD